jgi:hypothetical protein
LEDGSDDAFIDDEHCSEWPVAGQGRPRQSVGAIKGNRELVRMVVMSGLEANEMSAATFSGARLSRSNHPS